jgi:hypothetical protein
MRLTPSTTNTKRVIAMHTIEDIQAEARRIVDLLGLTDASKCTGVSRAALKKMADGETEYPRDSLVKKLMGDDYCPIDDYDLRGVYRALHKKYGTQKNVAQAAGVSWDVISSVISRGKTSYIQRWRIWECFKGESIVDVEPVKREMIMVPDFHVMPLLSAGNNKLKNYCYPS